MWPNCMNNIRITNHILLNSSDNDFMIRMYEVNEKVAKEKVRIN